MYYPFPGSPDARTKTNAHRSRLSLLAPAQRYGSPATVFKEGDQVWFVSNFGGITNGIIDYIDIRTGLPDLFYVYHKSYKACQLYKSQEALINAQINYWNNLQPQVVSNE